MGEKMMIAYSAISAVISWFIYNLVSGTIELL